MPIDSVVLYVHQHSLFPLTKTLGYFDALGTGFIASDANPPIKTAFERMLAYAEHEGVGRVVIVDPVGFGRLELKDLVA